MLVNLRGLQLYLRSLSLDKLLKFELALVQNTRPKVYIALPPAELVERVKKMQDGQNVDFTNQLGSLSYQLSRQRQGQPEARQQPARRHAPDAGCRRT